MDQHRSIKMQSPTISTIWNCDSVLRVFIVVLIHKIDNIQCRIIIQSIVLAIDFYQRITIRSSRYANTNYSRHLLNSWRIAHCLHSLHNRICSMPQNHHRTIHNYACSTCASGERQLTYIFHHIQAMIVLCRLSVPSTEPQTRMLMCSPRDTRNRTCEPPSSLPVLKTVLLRCCCPIESTCRSADVHDLTCDVCVYVCVCSSE